MARRRGHPLLERKNSLVKSLTEARVNANLTQDLAGKKIGKDKTFICKLERGTKIPKPHILRALAGIYDIPPEKLLEKAGYKEFPWIKVVKDPDKIPDHILDEITDEEKNELKRYLGFLRIVNSK